MIDDERYIGNETIGQGGQGWVYKVQDQESKNYYAKKVKKFRMNESKYRALKEIEIHLSLDHKNIIKILDNYYLQYPKYYTFTIIMEYASGGDLAHLIKKKRDSAIHFSENYIIKLMIDICEGVEYCISKRIAHLDLKPNNILLMDTGEVKLCDFGISAEVEKDQDKQLFKYGYTSAYAAPEILEKKGIRYNADIWSLGCILYELCALYRPYPIEYDSSLDYDKLPLMNYTAELRTLISNMLQPNQEFRPPVKTIIENLKNIFKIQAIEKELQKKLEPSQPVTIKNYVKIKDGWLCQRSLGYFIYLVKDTKSKECFVMKEISKKDCADEMSKIYQEIGLHKQLDDPHIIKLRDYFELENKLYIVLDFAEKGTLQELIKSRQDNYKPFTFDEIKNFLNYLIAGIKYLHNNNIIHGNLTPGNIFVTKDLYLKIGYFGESKKLKSDEYAKNLTSNPYYTSPEILSLNQTRFSSDIWPIGCILYELITLSGAFREKNKYILDDKIKRGIYDEKKLIRANCPSSMSNLVKEMLTTDAEVRPNIYKLARDLINLEEEWLAERDSQIVAIPEIAKPQKLNLEEMLEKHTIPPTRTIDYNAEVITPTIISRPIKHNFVNVNDTRSVSIKPIIFPVISDPEEKKLEHYPSLNTETQGIKIVITETQVAKEIRTVEPNTTYGPNQMGEFKKQFKHHLRDLLKSTTELNVLIIIFIFIFIYIYIKYIYIYIENDKTQSLSI